MVSEVYEELLGVGSYKQIYAKMPNIAFVTSVLMRLVTQLTEEVDKRIEPVSEVTVVKKTTTKKQGKK